MARYIKDIFTGKYRWDETQLAPHTPKPAKPAAGPFVLPDIAEFVSPVDYSVISSRSTLRAHEQRHQVRQCGELKTVADFDPNKVKPYRSIFD